MKVTKHRHFDWLTPLDEAQNEDELRTIFSLRYPKACHRLEGDAQEFARMVTEARKFQAWRLIHDERTGEPFASFDTFCERELGRTLEEVEAVVEGVRLLGRSCTEAEAKTAAEVMQRAPELAKHGGDRKTEAGRDQGRDATLKNRRDSSYLAARLKRDHPEIAKRVEAGEFKSMRAAAIEAGIVRPPTPLDTLRRAWRKASEGERRAFAREALHGIGGAS